MEFYWNPEVGYMDFYVICSLESFPTQTLQAFDLSTWTPEGGGRKSDTSSVRDIVLEKSLQWRKDVRDSICTGNIEGALSMIRYHCVRFFDENLKVYFPIVLLKTQQFLEMIRAGDDRVIVQV